MGTTAQRLYLRQMAEQGEKQPIGGRIRILWGSLYMLASLCAYATLSGFLPFSNSTVLNRTRARSKEPPSNQALFPSAIEHQAPHGPLLDYLLVQFSSAKALNLLPSMKLLSGGSYKPSSFQCTASLVLRWDWQWPQYFLFLEMFLVLAAQIKAVSHLYERD